jgi:hypothetical protein
MDRDRYHVLLGRYVQLGESLPPVEVLIENAAARRRARVTLMHLRSIRVELDEVHRGQ